ncbi:MAG: response regulator [Ideonella sp.]|nr:response regulator [Ideonella sp.]
MNGTVRAFIAEDEPPARERLTLSLARVAPQFVVAGHADSVRGTKAWLAAHPPPDLLLLDIQLADGLSLDLFADGTLALPTIFTTAFDRFAIDAFRALAIDYLLKPMADDALAQALHKAERLRRSLGTDIAALLLREIRAGRPAARGAALAPAPRRPQGDAVPCAGRGAGRLPRLGGQAQLRRRFGRRALPARDAAGRSWKRRSTRRASFARTAR